MDAYSELGRLHMLNYELEPAIGAAGVAAEIAQRLGLVEAHANARITMATARHGAGDLSGLGELRELTELCRHRRLLALPRATQNLAALLLEEGEWRESVALIRDGLRVARRVATRCSPASPRRHAGLFVGDLDVPGRLRRARRRRRRRWECVRGLRWCLRVLRNEPLDAPEDVAEAVAGPGAAVHRPLWTALAMAGLCRALQGRMTEAAQYVVELTEDWQKVRVVPMGVGVPGGVRGRVGRTSARRDLRRRWPTSPHPVGGGGVADRRWGRGAGRG